MPQNKSFERAVFDRDIKGPDWSVVDESGIPVDAGDQNFGGKLKDMGVYVPDGRPVRKHVDGYAFARVLDFQYPADVEADIK